MNYIFVESLLNSRSGLYREELLCDAAFSSVPSIGPLKLVILPTAGVQKLFYAVKPHGACDLRCLTHSNKGTPDPTVATLGWCTLRAFDRDTSRRSPSPRRKDQCRQTSPF